MSKPTSKAESRWSLFRKELPAFAGDHRHSCRYYKQQISKARRRHTKLVVKEIVHE